MQLCALSAAMLSIGTDRQAFILCFARSIVRREYRQCTQNRRYNL